MGDCLLTVGLTTGLLVPTIVLSAAGLALGIFALRRLTPPGTLVARPVLPAAILLRGVLTCTFFGVDAFVALTLVEWRGLSATEAGLVVPRREGYYVVYSLEAEKLATLSDDLRSLVGRG